MKMIHISDLHIGKKVNGYSMSEDQKYILEQIEDVIREEKPDVCLIAGDIYDKAVPPSDAVEIFSDFLTWLSKQDMQTFIIPGNHDSAERLAFASPVLKENGINIAHAYDGSVQAASFLDAYGFVKVYMLPYIKPAVVRAVHPDEEIISYTDAVASAIRHMEIDPEDRNVLLAHQFVAGSSQTDSEEISVGGTDSVASEIFSVFDYVALGHLHRGQKAGGLKICYSGSPLKYSFSEANDEKNAVIIELEEKGKIKMKEKELKPAREMSEIRGTFHELTNPDYYTNCSVREDYLHITLTDEYDVIDAAARLRKIYPYLMTLDYDNKRTQEGTGKIPAVNKKELSPMEMFSEFYRQQNGQEMDNAQNDFIKELFLKLDEKEEEK